MSFLQRLNRGEAVFDFIGNRRRWYIASAVLLLICVLSFVLRGFNFGIEFQGGTSFQFKAPANAQPADVEQVVSNAGATVASAPQEVGSGGTRQIVVKTGELTATEQATVKRSLESTYGEAVSVSSVSSSWGGDITRAAIKALVIFLILVCALIVILFEWKMAVGAIVALIHDLVFAAGVYSLVGFEVTPSTIIGLLTILGFSLYDTVVVFDKVKENTRSILGGTRMTYSEAANLAVNQTLMRSINTSLIALLPVAGLLFVGAGLLGVGTIKDLALVLFVGLAAGAYSSIFLATPIVCDLNEREPKYAALRKRVLAKRGAAVAKATPAVASTGVSADNEVGAEAEPATAGAGARASAGAVAASGSGSGSGSGGSAPRPGARPKRPQQRRGGGGRPSAKRRR